MIKTVFLFTQVFQFLVALKKQRGRMRKASIWSSPVVKRKQRKSVQGIGYDNLDDVCKSHALEFFHAHNKEIRELEERNKDVGDGLTAEATKSYGTFLPFYVLNPQSHIKISWDLLLSVLIVFSVTTIPLVSSLAISSAIRFPRSRSHFHRELVSISTRMI